MNTKTVIVNCKYGLHARVAAQVVKAARHREASVSIHCQGCAKANACSLIELLTLGAAQGVELRIEADGADENEALRAVAEVFENGEGI